MNAEAHPFPPLNRALPGWAVDAIFDGLPERQARDRRKLWGVCVRIAMSAQRRGWSESEYITEIVIRKSGLWRQLITRRDGLSYPEKRGYKELRSAWGAARSNVNDVGSLTRDEIAWKAMDLALAWVERITDDTDRLTEVEADVMRYVAGETERRGMLRVTCPGRAVAEFAKIPHRTAARVLDRLTKRGLLIKHSPGRRGKPPGSSGKGAERRAAIYGLVDPETLGT